MVTMTDLVGKSDLSKTARIDALMVMMMMMMMMVDGDGDGGGDNHDDGDDYD